MRAARSALPLLAFLALFLVVSLRHLDTAPQVYEDEPWQASVAYKLETQGIFGSDLFSGFFHMEQRYYGFMPLHPLLLAADFKALGPGLEQARLEPVLLTALTLILTYTLATRLFTTAVGALAIAILTLVRWAGATYVQLTGIPVIDLARIARYDPLVPVIGLAALHVYLIAGSHTSRWLYAAAGVLAGLAGLAHVYGLFWLPILVLLSLADARLRGTGVIAWILLGGILPWLPYAAYVLTDLPDWRGQTAIYASRFDLFNPSWYLNNLLQEYHRYGPGLGSPGLGWLARPGFWFCLVALPASLVALGRRALHGDAAARAIVIPALTMPALFALLITLKLVNYTLIELPLFAIAVAWGVHHLWQRTHVEWVRPALLAAGAAVAVEGGVALAQLDLAAATTTPLPVFESEIHQSLPAGARVLGLHTYWFGQQDLDYRSFLVPLNFADLGEPLDQALADVDPDIVLLDARMRAYFNALPPGGDGDRFRAWLTAHHAQRLASIDDPTYGLMEIYQVDR